MSQQHKKQQKKESLLQSKWIWIGGLLLFVFIFSQLGLFTGSTGNAHVSDVMLDISVSHETIASGDRIDIDVLLDNTKGESWEHMQVQLNFPQGFVLDTTTDDEAFQRSSHLWDIGAFSGRKTALTLSGRLFGDIGSTQEVHAEFFGKTPQAQDFDTTSSTKEIMIEGSIVSMDVQMPSSFPIQSLQDITFTYDVPDDVPLTIAIGYEMSSAIELRHMNVDMSEDQLWLDMGQLQGEPVQGQVFVNEERGVSEDMHFKLYVIESGKTFLQQELSVPVRSYDTGARVYFSVNEKQEDAALHVGKQNSFAVSLRNIGNEPLQDVSVSIPLSKGLLKEETVSLSGARYENERLVIDGKSDARLNTLSPGARIPLLFSVPLIEEVIPENIFETVRDELFMQADVSYQYKGVHVQTQTDPMIVKLNSDLRATVTKTEKTYTISLYNSLNWVDDVSIDVLFSEPIQIDQVQGLSVAEDVLTWNVGRVSPKTTPHERSFTISSEEEAEITEIRVSGFDMHTEQQINEVTLY